MPTPSVSVPYEHFRLKANRHAAIVAGLSGVEPTLQKLLAELVMMRLFDDFQEALSGIATRLACGATYGDGSAPVLLVSPASSSAGARDLFMNHGRPRPNQMKWSKVPYINETIKFVMSTSDHFGAACSAQSLEISEMQAVRNRIAHNSQLA